MPLPLFALNLGAQYLQKVSRPAHGSEPIDSLTLIPPINCRDPVKGIRIALTGASCTSGLKRQPRAGFATPGRNRDGLQRDFLDGM